MIIIHYGYASDLGTNLQILFRTLLYILKYFVILRQNVTNKKKYETIDGIVIADACFGSIGTSENGYP
jgi:hypothetical protein